MKLFAALPILLIPIMSLHAQELSKADSGWVPLFDGQSFEGLRVSMYNQNPRFTDINTQDAFVVENETIHAVGTDQGDGHVGTQATFTHYRMRVEYKFGDNTGAGSNAGLMYHLDEDHQPYMSGLWPRSIECQMKKDQTGDAFSIVEVTYEVPTNPGSGCQYWEGGTDSITSAQSIGCRQTTTRPQNDNPYVDGEWNRMEVVVRGHERATHIVNDVKLLELFNIRVPDGNDYVDYGEGSLGLQIEGADISYQNWEIMELPETGPDYLHRIIVTSPVGGENLSTDDPHDITWNHIGSFATVNIEYSANGGTDWVSIQQNAENSGTFNWVPSPVTAQGKIRISGTDPWTQAGESPETFTITGGMGLNDSRTHMFFNIKIPGAGQVYSSFIQPEKIWITNIQGNRIANYNTTTGSWTGTQFTPGQTPPGIYVLHVQNTNRLESRKFLIK